MAVSAAGLSSGLSAATVQQALTAGETQTLNQAKAKRAYDYVVIGSGASGSIIAGDLSKTGADVLVVESGGEDAGATISNPSIWFYNVGGPLDWTLPIAPVPQLNNRQFNMALGRVLGGGSSVNAMVWTRGTEQDYDTWERHGATGWAFKDVLPTFKAQEDWEGGTNDWRGVGGPVHIRTPGDPHPTAPAFLEAAQQMGFPIIDDMNGPMRAGAGYINMNIAVDGSRASSARAFLRPNLGRPNLTLLLNTHATRVLYWPKADIPSALGNVCFSNRPVGVKRTSQRRVVMSPTDPEQTSATHFRVFHALSVSLRNLSLALGFVARLSIADPCVSRKPFMRRIAVRTVGLPEKDRARAENRGLNVCAGGNRSSGFRATNHKNTHQADSWLCVGRTATACVRRKDKSPTAIHRISCGAAITG